MAVEIVMPRLGWTMEEGTIVEWLKKPGEAVQAGEVLFTVETDKAINEVESFDAGRLHIPEDAPGPGATVAVGTVLGYLLAEGEVAPASVTAPAPAAGRGVGPAATSGEAGQSAASAPAGATPAASSEGARQGAAGAQAGAAPEVTPTGSAPQEAAKAPPAAEAAPGQTPPGTATPPGGGTADAHETSAPAEPSSAPTISPRARRLAQKLGIDWRKVRGTGRTGRITEDDVRAAAARDR